MIIAIPNCYFQIRSVPCLNLVMPRASLALNQVDNTTPLLHLLTNFTKPKSPQKIMDVQ